MKKNVKAVFMAMLAALLALVILPVSACKTGEPYAEKTELTPCWTVPEGYNEHDCNKCAAYLEQKDDDGIKNGEKLSSGYDPNRPETWGIYYYEGAYSSSDCFQWSTHNGELRIKSIYVVGENQCGNLDVSGCIALNDLNCSSNSISKLDVSGNVALNVLYCCQNKLTELDVTNNVALVDLDCAYNNISALDLSACALLEELRCFSNDLITLDVSNNPSLKYLYLRFKQP